MKTLLIGSLVVIFIIIGGAATFMILDSANTIDAQVVTKTDTTPVEKTTSNVVNTPVPEDTTTATSATDALKDLKANGDIAPTTTIDTEKTGFSLNYQVQQNQNTCDTLIEFKQKDVDDAQEDYNDAQKAYEKAMDLEDDVDSRDEEAIEEVQDKIKERKEELDDAEAALFSAKDELIQARTTCQS
jgi:predicted lipid-binding transport protein (Tim44 family)